MIPMGLGMAAVNAGVLIMPGGVQGNLFLDPMVTDTDQLMNILQIDFLQPVYTFMFSNGLIACLIFMGIGTMLDINFLLAKPLQSMFLALCAELGTFVVVPIAFAMGLSPNDSASIAMVGGADGPMVLFASLNLSKSIFVPITVVAYLYLGLTYGGWLMTNRADMLAMMKVWDDMIQLLREQGVHRLIYKPVPHIYHRYPAEEELYALYRAGAVLRGRQVSATVDLTCPLPFRKDLRHKLAPGHACRHDVPPVGPMGRLLATADRCAARASRCRSGALTRRNHPAHSPERD